MSKSTKIILSIIAAVTVFYIAMNMREQIMKSQIVYSEEMVPYLDGNDYKTLGIVAFAEDNKFKVEMLCNTEKKHLNAYITPTDYKSSSSFSNEVEMGTQSFVQLEFEGTPYSRKTLANPEKFLNTLYQYEGEMVSMRVNGDNAMLDLDNDDLLGYLKEIEYGCK